MNSALGQRFVVFAALLAAMTSACAQSEQAAQTGAAPSPTTTLPAQPEYRISAKGTKGHPVTISNIVRGLPEYTLAAASVVYATNLQQGNFKDNTLYFYKGRKLRLTVTAPAAIVNQVSHDVALSGGVVARTAAGETLTSDTMNYNEKTRLLTANGHVVAGDPSGNKLTGSRAIADLDLQQIKLFGEGNVATKPTRGPTR